MDSEELRKSRRRSEHKRYYAETAFLYRKRSYSKEEDALILAHAVPDRELSETIHRSMKAICNRRWRLLRKKWEQEDAKTI